MESERELSERSPGRGCARAARMAPRRLPGGCHRPLAVKISLGWAVDGCPCVRSGQRVGDPVRRHPGEPDRSLAPHGHDSAPWDIDGLLLVPSLTGEANPGRGHDSEAWEGDGPAAAFAHAEGPGAEPGDGGVDILELVALVIFEAGQAPQQV